MGLFAKLFPKAAELQKANDRIEVLEVKHAELTQRNKSLWDSCNANERALQDKSAELDKVLAKVREQNDADLLLVSMQIVQRVVAGEKKETSPQLRALYSQQSALQNSPYASYANQLGSVGMLGGLGGMWYDQGYPFRQ